MLKFIKSVVYILALFFSYTNTGLAASSDCISTVSKVGQEKFNEVAGQQYALQMEAAGNWRGIVKVKEEESESQVESTVEYGFRRSLFYKPSDRSRIQQNFYELPEVTRSLSIEYDFILSSKQFQIVNSAAAFEWYTISEIWVAPGWRSFSNPYRISVNLVKHVMDKHLTIRISGESKSEADGNWLPEWQSFSDIKVVTGRRYSMNLSLNMVGRGDFNARITDRDNDTTDKMKKRLFSSAIENKWNSIWGVNPIKLYTGKKVLDRFEAYDSIPWVKFIDPVLCLHS